MTTQHLEAMQAGRKRAADRRRDEKAATLAAFRAWSKREAARWAARQTAEDMGDPAAVARYRAAAKADPMP